jgi:hypothetical protein
MHEPPPSCRPFRLPRARLLPVMGIRHVIGRGSNDIQRNIITQTALGLPR